MSHDDDDLRWKSTDPSTAPAPDPLTAERLIAAMREIEKAGSPPPPVLVLGHTLHAVEPGVACENCGRPACGVRIAFQGHPRPTIAVCADCDASSR